MFKTTHPCCLHITVFVRSEILLALINDPRRNKANAGRSSFLLSPVTQWSEGVELKKKRGDEVISILNDVVCVGLI